MLLPILIAAVAAAGVVGLSGWYVIRSRKSLPTLPRRDQDAEEPTPQLPVPVQVLAPFGASVGDVLQDDHDDYWITGALVLQESTRAVVGICCLSERSISDRVLLMMGPEERVVAEFLEKNEIFAGRPLTVQLDAVLFRRKSVLPVSYQSVGQGCQFPGGTASWSDYRDDQGNHVWVLHGPFGILAWKAKPDPLTSWKNLGGGQATLRRWE